jgi:L-fuconolactonase
MIGSDWPVCTLAGTYERVMSIVLDHIAGLPRADQDAILGGVATRYYSR